MDDRQRREVAEDCMFELEESMESMREALDRATRALMDFDTLGQEQVCGRARSYWLAHIRTAIDSDHGFMGGSMCTMADTLEEMRGSLETEMTG